MTAVVIIGWVAALTATLLGVPQAVRLVRTRNTEGLSLLAWQAIGVINLAWTSHGILIGQWNMIIPNALAISSTVPVLYLMAKDLRISLLRVVVPVLLAAAAMISIDLIFGSAAFGVAGIVAAVIANASQSVELVRAPHVDGVSPLFLVAQVVNQTLWLTWAFLVPDIGTIISAGVTWVIAGFNLFWWLWRYAFQARVAQS